MKSKRPYGEEAELLAKALKDIRLDKAIGNSGWDRNSIILGWMLAKGEREMVFDAVSWIRKRIKR